MNKDIPLYEFGRQLTIFKIQLISITDKIKLKTGIDISNLNSYQKATSDIANDCESNKNRISKQTSLN